jgi:hypothetical protein
MNTDDIKTTTDANVTIRKKTTIPSKQKTTLKLILWTLTRVMDLETANAKAIEMFKLGESIETIIEEVDNIEKSAEYAEMDMNLASLCVKPAKKSRAKKEAITISGDADTIIKEMVEMATAEVKATPVKKPRVKKVAEETDVLVPVLDEEPKAKTKAKTKTTKKSDENVSTEVLPEVLPEVKVEEPETVKKPRTKAKANAKTNESVENVSTEASTEFRVEEPVKKSRAKPKTKASTEDDNVEKEEPVKKPRAKPKTKAEPPEETPITNDLVEEEYLVLNEVEYEGKQYMVGGDQNVYDEFNAVIGKYENGIITLNA